MRILSIETATMLGGIAIMDSELGLIAERRLNVKATHSERLMPELEGMLEVAGVTINELGAIAVSMGPGALGLGRRAGWPTVTKANTRMPSGISSTSRTCCSDRVD